jgi:2-phospho-L-lactate guanylyltransferase
VAGNQTWAVLPAKPFDAAKSRLDSVLNAEERHVLARALLLHSLDALRKSAAVDQILVVSSDPLALHLAKELGAETLRETRTGLNPALDEARRYAVTRGALGLLVLACDLPLVTAGDISALFAAASDGVVIAHDRRKQGTNALLLRPPDAIEFAFGEGSLQRHRELAISAGTDVKEISLTGLAFDVDLPEDWQALQAIGWRLQDASGVAGPVQASLDPAGPGRHAPALRGPHPIA